MLDHLTLEKHVQTLSGTKLAYEFAQALDFATLGSSQGPFAALSTDSETIAIFGGDDESVKLCSFEGEMASIPLRKAKEIGAKLWVQDGVAQCQIGNVSTYGETYVEAIMRAIVLSAASSKINPQ